MEHAPGRSFSERAYGKPGNPDPEPEPDPDPDPEPDK